MPDFRDQFDLSTQRTTVHVSEIVVDCQLARVSPERMDAALSEVNAELLAVVTAFYCRSAR